MIDAPFAWGATTVCDQTNRGGSCAQVGRPGQKEPGRPEGLPRTATIKRICGRKKSACNRYGVPVRILFVGRPSPFAEFAAMTKG